MSMLVSMSMSMSMSQAIDARGACACRSIAGGRNGLGRMVGSSDGVVFCAVFCPADESSGSGSGSEKKHNGGVRMTEAGATEDQNHARLLVAWS